MSSQRTRFYRVPTPRRLNEQQRINNVNTFGTNRNPACARCLKHLKSTLELQCKVLASSTGGRNCGRCQRLHRPCEPPHSSLTLLATSLTAQALAYSALPVLHPNKDEAGAALEELAHLFKMHQLALERQEQISAPVDVGEIDVNAPPVTIVHTPTGASPANVPVDSVRPHGLLGVSELKEYEGLLAHIPGNGTNKTLLARGLEIVTDVAKEME